MAKTVPLFKILATMTLHGGPPGQITHKEAAGQSYAVGEIVYLAAGLVTIIGSQTPADIYGVVHRDATGTAGSETPVWLAEPDVLFEANLVEEGEGGAIANHVAVQADIGSYVGIFIDAANKRMYLDASQTGASARAFIHRLAKDSDMGDTNARFLFNFLPANVQFETQQVQIG